MDVVVLLLLLLLLRSTGSDGCRCGRKGGAGADHHGLRRAFLVFVLVVGVLRFSRSLRWCHTLLPYFLRPSLPVHGRDQPAVIFEILHLTA